MRKNLVYKITAVALALILWAFVMSKGSVVVTETVPVSFTDMPSGLAVNPDESMTSISVSFDAHERFLKNLDPSDIHVPLSLKDAKPGQRYFSIDEEAVELPFPLRLRSVSPLAVKVALEKIITRKIPVKVAVEGVPASGYSVADVSVLPEKVEAVGISSLVRELSVLTAEPVEITNASSTVETDAAIMPPNGGIALGSDKIRVKVTIRKK